MCYVLIALYPLKYILQVIITELEFLLLGIFRQLVSVTNFDAIPPCNFEACATTEELNSLSSCEGIFKIGLHKSKTILAEDDACCICQINYLDGEVIKLLPCSHYFHTVCINKWLQHNALCPFCRLAIPRLPSRRETISNYFWKTLSTQNI